MGIIGFLVLVAIGWKHTFHSMFLRWYPAWERSNYTLSQRLTEGESYYSHGPLVPIACLILAFIIYRRVGAPMRRSRAASVVGWLLLIASLCLHLICVYADVMFASGFSLIGVMGGAILICGGFPLARAYWLPVAFLVFMVPLPEVAISSLNFRLKFLAANAALWLTNTVFRIPAIMDGSYLYLPRAADGAQKVLVVENVCGGLRSLISLVCFASLFALICRVKGVWRLFMLALALPVAVLCNVIRITGLNVVAHHWTVADAGPGSWFHDYSGIAVFVLALALLFAVEHVIIWVAGRLKRPWTDDRLLGYLNVLRREKYVSQGGVPVVMIVVLVLATALSFFWADPADAMNMTKRAAGAAPTEMLIGDDLYVGTDMVLDDRTLDILQTNDYLYRRFFHAKSRRYVDFLIVFSANNRKGTHPPEVCLSGSGEEIITSELYDAPAGSLGDIPMRELVTQRRDRQTYYLYTFKSGDAYTPSFFKQQMMIFINGLLPERNTAGALIRFHTHVPERDVDTARTLTVAAVATLMPEVSERLP